MNDLSLIETLRWETGAGFTRLDLHLARLERSARYVGFPQPRFAGRRLEEAVAGVKTPLRVRLVFHSNARFDVTTAPYVGTVPGEVWKVRVAAQRLDSADKLLRIKSTRRHVYEAARAEFPLATADEVLLLNERDEVCEGTITSIFLDDGSGLLLTPPLSCGLLAGVLRTELIRQGKARLSRISLAEAEAGKLYVGNSLRGLIEASLQVS